MSILEKLGILSAPWKVSPASDGMVVSVNDIMHDQYRYMAKAYTDTKMTYDSYEAHTNLIAAAPQMLEALVKWATTRETFEFSNDLDECISLIETATGKSWEEIKELTRGQRIPGDDYRCDSLKD